MLFIHRKPMVNHHQNVDKIDWSIMVMHRSQKTIEQTKKMNLNQRSKSTFLFILVKN